MCLPSNSLQTDTGMCEPCCRTGQAKQAKYRMFRMRGNELVWTLELCYVHALEAELPDFRARAAAAATRGYSTCIVKIAAKERADPEMNE